jgi:uncharacterized peroxidase-related enzyme
MTFINTISEDQAQGLVQEQYQVALKNMGYVPEYIKAFSLRPEVYEAWIKLIGAIRPNLRLRRYELVTFASAMALECAACVIAHGALLRKNFFSADQLQAIVKDFRNAGLSPEEVTLMSFAQQITTQAHQISSQDLDEIRGHGLSDEEILDVVLAITARNFFSKTLDTLGVKPPDEAHWEFEPELLQFLLASGGKCGSLPAPASMLC